MCSWCICLLAARQDCEHWHREEKTERDRRKENRIIMIAKLSWLRLFLLSYFTEAILWSYPMATYEQKTELLFRFGS